MDVSTILSVLYFKFIIFHRFTRSCKSIASFERVVMVNERREIHYALDSKICEHSGSNEMDTHVDIYCLGKNFIPLYHTGEMCNVHAFSPEHVPDKDVRIDGGATLWFDHDFGSGYILVVHQALMFTDTLVNTLLNPNQIRKHGHSLCDALGINTVP